jgi:4-aminobutyrate aminotransferase-like enzyme
VQEICDVFEPGNHASTFGGNPLVCAAGLTVLNTIEQDHLLENVCERGGCDRVSRNWRWYDEKLTVF